MKAVIFERCGPPEVLSVREIPTPTPRDHQVLVRVHACGVCRRDVLTRMGPPPRGLALPTIPGHEIAGEVAALGPEATGFAVADRVCSTQRARVCGRCSMCRSGRETLCAELQFLGQEAPGGYAEYVLVGDDNLVRLPDAIPFPEGAILACTVGTTYNAVCETGCVRPGDRVVIAGGGGLGAHAIQVARFAGAFVVAVTTSPPKVAALREAGAHEVVVATNGRFADRVRAALSGGGADLAIDTVGGAVFHEVRRSMAPGGRIVLVGEVTGRSVELDLASIYRRGLEIRSAVSASRRQLERAVQLVAAGAVRPMVSQILTLDEARAAHAQVERGPVVGRIVLTP